MHRPLALGLVTGLFLMAGAARPATAQASPEFEWRMSLGLGLAQVHSTYPHADAGQTEPLFTVSLERRVMERLAVGIEWRGFWYDDRWGSRRRHSLTLSGATYPVRGLRVAGGIGTGVASWTDIVSTTGIVASDVLIDVYDGEPALVLTGNVAYDVALGPFQLSPEVGLIGHRLQGQMLTMSWLGGRLSLRTWR